MSLTIGGGYAIGVALSDMTLNYTKRQYKERIAELEECVSLLNGHLSNLNTYRGQLKSVWDDDANAEEYGKLLDVEIRSVENAQTHIKQQIETWQQAIDEMKDTETQIEEKVGDIRSILDALDIK